MNLNKHLKEYQILTQEHHGRLESHSTLTAKTIIDYESTKVFENDDQGALQSTDLSTALNTTDHQILFDKLENYKIEGIY